jgi:hypothetical protein
VLPWNETAVKGLRLDKDGGKWINTPLPVPAESRIERRADLELTSTGALQGEVTVTYTGQEALWRRLEERHEDDTERKRYLEDQLQRDIPSGLVAELTNGPEWDNSSATLVAAYEVKIPGWAMLAGPRALFPTGLFGGKEKNMLQHAVRVQPLYFNFPYQSSDDVTIKLPTDWQMSSMPAKRSDDCQGLVYSSSTELKDGRLHFRRDLSMNVTLLPDKYYSLLQDFFHNVRNGDEDRAVVIRPQNLAIQ